MAGIVHDNVEVASSAAARLRTHRLLQWRSGVQCGKRVRRRTGRRFSGDAHTLVSYLTGFEHNIGVLFITGLVFVLRVSFHTGLVHVVGLILVIGFEVLLLVLLFIGFGYISGSHNVTGLVVVFLMFYFLDVEDWFHPGLENSGQMGIKQE